MGCFSSTPKATEQNKEEEYDKAVLGLKVARDRVKKYQTRLEADAAKQTELAKQLIREKKMEKAKLVIRAKKLREDLVSKADGQLQNIQTQLDNLEQAKLNRELYDNLEKTNGILKMMNEQLTVEQVEALMDENAEQGEQINEITALLTQSMTPADMEVADEEYEELYNQLHPQEEVEEEQKEYEEEAVDPTPQRNRPVMAATLV